MIIKTEESLFDKWSKVKAFVFDIDGVFTNGIIYLIKEGLMARTINIKDGYALQVALGNDYPVAVISGGNAENVRDRLVALGVRDIYMRVHDKLATLREWCEQRELKLTECLYMGDDMPDFACMQNVGLAACPKDACVDIVQIAHFISSYPGGHGCVREVIERVLKIQNKWKLPS